MVLISIFGPPLMLMAASLGFGWALLLLSWTFRAGLPASFKIAAAYFLGQSLLAIGFMLLALGGMFKAEIIYVPVLLGTLLLALFVALGWRKIGEAARLLLRGFVAVGLPWKILILATLCLFIYGLGSMGRPLEGDATAFYFAAAKAIASSGSLVVVPGYNTFSWVIMTAEMLYASLMLLGSPGTGARVLDWLNSVPTLLALYALGRCCRLSPLGCLLTFIVVLTSTAVVGLWGSGKTDNFALGPAFVAFACALMSWRSPSRLFLIAAAGAFCGFAIMIKVTYAAVVLPCCLLLLFWCEIRQLLPDLADRHLRAFGRGVVAIAAQSIPFVIAFVAAISPFLFKNFVMFHWIVGPEANSAEKWFSDPTISRILMTYPLALTFGRYWGQLGTLSPLLLATFPLFFFVKRRERALATPLAAITIAAFVSLVIWAAFKPSIFMPRYILAVLLLLSIPAAAGVVHVCRGKAVASWAFVGIMIAVMACMPDHIRARLLPFDTDRAFAYFSNGDEAKLFENTDDQVATMSAVNARAGKDERVLLLVYPRLWLRSDLIMNASSGVEVGTAHQTLKSDASEFWKFLRSANFKFIILDSGTAFLFQEALKVKPETLPVCRVSSHGIVTAFALQGQCGD
jgi:hypothetical protein